MNPEYVQSKLIKVQGHDSNAVASALWVKRGGVWSCLVAAPVLAWMRGMAPQDVKAKLESDGQAYSWH